jgi:hypothetical protein
MNSPHSVLKRLLLAGGLALGVLATAALGGPSAAAQPAPGSQGMPSICPQTGCMAAPIHNVQVKPLGTQATLTFNTLEPSFVVLEHTPLTTTATLTASRGQRAQAADGTPMSKPVTPRPASYATTHEHKLTGLASNTTYNVVVTAHTQSGQKHTTTTSFTTLKKRVRVILQSIDIKDDGDWVGDGEPMWTVTPVWDGGSFVSPKSGRAAGFCYPHGGSENVCKYGEFGEGRHTPRNPKGKALSFVFAEEDFDRFPSTITLHASAEEDDATPDIVCTFSPAPDDGDKVEWRVPQGVEGAYQLLTVRGDDSCAGFESVLTFSVELLHNNAPYPPALPNSPSVTWWG